MKIKQTVIAMALLIGTLGALMATPVLATAGDLCGGTELKEGQSCCDGVVTSVIGCESNTGDGVTDLLLWVINIMTTGIGILAVGGLVYASIKYSVAQGQPDAVRKARVMIANIIVGIIMYVLMYALLNYLIPGGLFNNA